jgi:hypothetical protein
MSSEAPKMKGRYEIIDTHHPTWRGQRFTDKKRAEKVLAESVPPGRFVIKDRAEKKIIGRMSSNGLRTEFDDWMMEVDNEIWSRTGYSAEGIGDFSIEDLSYRDMYESGRSPSQVAARAMRSKVGRKENVIGRNFQRMSARDLVEERSRIQGWVDDIIARDQFAAYGGGSNNAEKVQRYMKEISQINDELANLREGRIRGSIRKALVEKHNGPGPHKSGSSQDVHGKSGSRGGKGKSYSGKTGSNMVNFGDSDLGSSKTKTSSSSANRAKFKVGRKGGGYNRPGGGRPADEGTQGKLFEEKLMGEFDANPKAKPPKKGPRPLHEIADEIRRDWKKVNYAAVPYLDAMGSLSDISDNYYADSGAGVVSYFLTNAGSWRGETARRVKKELKDMLKANKDGLSSTPGRGGPRFRKAFPQPDPKAKMDPKKKGQLPTIAEAKQGKIAGQPANPAPPKAEEPGMEGEAKVPGSQTPTPGAPTPEGMGLSANPGAAPLGPGTAPGKRPVETPKKAPAPVAAKPKEPVVDDKKKAIADRMKQKGMPPSGGKPF